MPDSPPLSEAEFEELRRRFPRAGYWFGMLPTHPEIHPDIATAGPRLPTRELNGTPSSRTLGRPHNVNNPPPTAPTHAAQGLRHSGFRLQHIPAGPPHFPQPVIASRTATGMLQAHYGNAWYNPALQLYEGLPPPPPYDMHVSAAAQAPGPLPPPVPLPPPPGPLPGPLPPPGPPPPSGPPPPYSLHDPARMPRATVAAQSGTAHLEAAHAREAVSGAPATPAVQGQRRVRQGPPGDIPLPPSVLVTMPQRENGTITRVVRHFPTDISFADFVDRACANMNLHPANAELGYKFHTDRVRDPPHRLANEDDLEHALQTAARLMRFARTRVITMDIHHLNGQPPTAAHGGSAKKRKADDNAATDNDQASTTMSCVLELRQLKQRLSCAKHPNRYCYIDPYNGGHHRLNDYDLTFWAKQIVRNEASLTRPPNNGPFDTLSKRPRRDSPPARAGPSNMPEIHVHLPSTLPALGDQRGQRRVNTTASVSTPSTSGTPSSTSASTTRNAIAAAPASENDPPLATSSAQVLDTTRSPATAYPPMSAALDIVQQRYPSLNLSPVADALLDRGYTTVQKVADADPNALLEVGVPYLVMIDMLEEAEKLAHRAEKGKTRANGSASPTASGGADDNNNTSDSDEEVAA